MLKYSPGYGDFKQRQNNELICIIKFLFFFNKNRKLCYV